MNNSINVTIVHPLMHHYRIPLFRELSNNPELNAYILSSISHPSKGLYSSHSEEVKYSFVKTIYWHGLVFQILPLSVLETPVLILPFDLRFLSNYLPLLYRKIRKKRTILWGQGLSNRKSPWYVLFFRKKLAQIADAIIFYDEHRKNYFERNLKIEPNKLFVAPNTIDIQPIKEAFAAEGKRERTQILYVGRLVPYKKVDILIKAFLKIHQDLPRNIGLTIVGDGSERRFLEQLVAFAGLQARVRFVGEVTDERYLAKYFSEALMLAYPGNIGLAAIHSFAYGVPVLLSRDGTHGPEATVVIDSEIGIWFQGSSPDAMAQAILDALENPQKLVALGRKGQEIVFDTFSISKMVQTFLLASRAQPKL